jgi:two-component system, OmpR family, response regulator
VLTSQSALPSGGNLVQHLDPRRAWSSIGSMSGEIPILVVDDDPHIREVLRFSLEKAGFRIHEAANGAEGLKRFDEVRPSLVVLDILMPEMDGTDVCRQLRSRSQVPIVFLSSKDDEVDRIVGLELGGDDYVTKPFSPRELVARVKAVLRRSSPAEAKGPDKPRGRLACGKLALDLDRFEAHWDGKLVVLTVTEFGILKTLMGHPGRVYTRSELMEGAYEEDNIVSDRTMDSHVRRVRRKFADLGADPIETVHGFGYKLGPCA